MSHEIVISETGKAAFSFTGDRSKIWHGLGQELTKDSSLETWEQEAGMDWNIQSSPIYYDFQGLEKKYANRRVLHRSDTGKELSIVSDSYKVVQPKQILEFFRDLISDNGMNLSTAGVLFGGKVFWAMADTNYSEEIISGDKVKGRLLLTTSCDGSSATMAKFVAERVVCANTLAVAVGESKKNQVKIHHGMVFDERKVKLDMGLVESSWDKYMAQMKKLSQKKMSEEEVLNFFKTFEENEESSEKLVEKKFQGLVSAYKNGAGAAEISGTAWGALNAVTNFYTHGFRSEKRAETKFMDSIHGPADTKKTLAFDILCATV